MLESIVSDVADNYGNNFQINAVLDDTVKNSPTAPVDAFVFWRYADEPTAEPQPLGVATIGTEFVIPIDIEDGRDIELFAVAKTANGEQSAVNPLDGLTYKFSPNRETGTPDFSQVGSAQNLRIDFTATGYTVAKFRKIQWDTVNTFDSVDIADRTKIEGDVNTTLPNAFFISRDSGGSTLDVYVRIAHSTNNQRFGAWSATKTATFANSGGTGGSGAGDPPSNLNYFLSGNQVNLYWTDGTGTNSIYRNGDLLDTASSNYTDTLTEQGWYGYVISNDDGSSNSIYFYYSGYEF